MITHDQVKSVSQHLEWQIAAWRRIQERHPEERAFVVRQIDYIEGKLQQAQEWNNARWGIPSAPVS